MFINELIDQIKQGYAPKCFREYPYLLGPIDRLDGGAISIFDFTDISEREAKQVFSSYEGNDISYIDWMRQECKNQTDDADLIFRWKNQYVYKYQGETQDHYIVVILSE